MSELFYRAKKKLPKIFWAFPPFFVATRNRSCFFRIKSPGAFAVVAWFETKPGEAASFLILGCQTLHFRRGHGMSILWPRRGFLMAFSCMLLTTNCIKLYVARIGAGSMILHDSSVPLVDGSKVAKFSFWLTSFKD